MKKKPQEEEKKAPEASKFLKGAAVSPNTPRLSVNYPKTTFLNVVCDYHEHVFTIHHFVFVSG